MKITIIGWYGTETLGDRAILSGVISLCQEAFYGSVEYKIGTIYPFFTERTFIEDESFIKEFAGGDFSLDLFSTKNKHELTAAIKWCDLLLIGGGPFEDIPSMFMLEYAFSYAKKIGRKSCVLGCGLGPLYKKWYQKSAVKIIETANAVILRDKVSSEEYKRLSGKKSEIEYSCDPSVFTLDFFKRTFFSETKNQTVVCVRRFPNEYKINKSIDSSAINEKIIRYCDFLSTEFNSPLILLPMHYFAVGDDDRYFMNEIEMSLERKNVFVQNEPLTLYETMMAMCNSERCVGMRFHSVVFQTILNGKNVVLDYTDPSSGKIGNFMKLFDIEKISNNRFCNLQTTNKFPSFSGEKIIIKDDMISAFRNKYLNVLKSIFSSEVS